MRADSAALASLTAGVNYYANVSKAAQVSQTSDDKSFAWDWLSANSNKTPIKDILKSLRYHSECTFKASYELVKTAKEIVAIVQKVIFDSSKGHSREPAGTGKDHERNDLYGSPAKTSQFFFRPGVLIDK